MSRSSKDQRALEKEIAQFLETAKTADAIARAKSNAIRAAQKIKVVAEGGKPKKLKTKTATTEKAADRAAMTRVIEGSKPTRAAPSYIHNAEDLALVVHTALRRRRTRMSEVAEVTGCHRKTVESLLGGTGNPTLEVITKVADAAGLTLCLLPKPQQ